MWVHFSEFLTKPWRGSDDMTALDWTLFVGLILVILLFWGIVLQHLKEALEG
jgi:hypothetical protein